MYHAAFFKMNIPVEIDDILNTPVCKLNASSEFKLKTKEMDFENLSQITTLGWGELQRLEKFSYFWFNELVRILEEHNALHLLEKR